MKFFVLLTALLSCGLASKLSFKDISSIKSSYIVKGRDAIPYSAPYIVSIGKGKKYHHSCGGTIIAKDWILSAAHCFGSDNTNVTIVAGLYDQSAFNSKVQVRRVDFIKTHENYVNGPLPNDIALLHLSVPLVYNRYVQPAALPAVGEIPSGRAHLYGWGMFDPFIYETANLLQTVETDITDFNKCKLDYPTLAETNLCTGSLEKQISACTADSGGPLVIERAGTPSEVIGVVSYGSVPCGVKNLPTVYVRVSAFIEWIVKVQNAYYTLY